MRKKLLSGLVILAVISFGISGCRGKKSVSGKKVEIRFENWEVTPEQLRIWQEVTDKFNQSQKDVFVKFQGIQGGPDKILIEIGGGSAPDVFFWDTHILSSLVKKKGLVNLAPFIKEAGINPTDYFAASWSGCVYPEGTFGLPCYWGENAIAYNKDLFDKAKTAYPKDDWNWDEFLKIARQLTIEKNGKTIQYGTTTPGLDPHFIGQNWFDEKGRFTGDNKEMEQLLQFIQDLRYKYKVAPSLPGLPPKDYYRQEMELFMTGKVAMFNVSSWSLPTLKNIKTFNWDIAPTPLWKSGKKSFEEGSAVLCVSAQSKYPKEAFQFVRFACGKEGQAILGKGRNCVPTLKDVAYSVFAVPPPEHIKVFLTQSEGEKVSPSAARFPWYNEWDSKILSPERDKLLLNIQTAKATLKNLKINTEKFLKE